MNIVVVILILMDVEYGSPTIKTKGTVLVYAKLFRTIEFSQLQTGLEKWWWHGLKVLNGE